MSGLNIQQKLHDLKLLGDNAEDCLKADGGLGAKSIPKCKALRRALGSFGFSDEEQGQRLAWLQDGFAAAKAFADTAVSDNLGSALEKIRDAENIVRQKSAGGRGRGVLE